MRENRKTEQLESIDWENEFPEIPVCVHDAVKIATGEILSKKQSKIRQIQAKRIPAKRMLLLAAVITLLSGMSVVAATSLWKQRMEAMNREEIEEYFLSIASSNAPSFRYNRAMTEEERALLDELTVSYENEGIFPEGVLTMLSSVDDYKGKGVGYEKKSGTFFLPEEALNEEQLLQIIDFYHKAEYAISSMNELAEQEEIQEIIKDEIVQEEAVNAKVMSDYEPLNDAVSYYEVSMQGEDILNGIAAGREYLYLGFLTEIKRMVLGSDKFEAFYELGENETLYAIDSDDNDNVYLSLRVYDASSDSYSNRLLKVDADGEVVLEYNLETAVYDEEKTLRDAVAYKMLADDAGLLYVKGEWSSKPVIFTFDTEGNCIGKMETDEYKTHMANRMCFDDEGHLYVLAYQTLLKFDEKTGEVAEAYNYWTEDMAAAVDIVYPMDETSFYVLSYDGLFRYTVGEEGSERLLAPYESEVFSEGYRCEPISQEELVIVNATDYKNHKYKITYLSLNK